MKKLMFVIFYDPIEYIDSIKTNLEKYYLDVITYPLFKYAYDVNNKIKNYVEHMLEFIDDNKPDIILWWFIDIPLKNFKRITNETKHLYHIFYNSDDPFNLFYETYEKCKLIDLIITSCKESLDDYTLLTKKKNILHMPFGFDQNVFHPLDNSTNFLQNEDKYSSDIIIYTNDLFTKENTNCDQCIDQIDMIKNLINYVEKNNRILKLYGTFVLKEYFSKYYFGNVPYSLINVIYNKSKIIIITHHDKNYTFGSNKNLLPALASGGLVLVDNIKDIQLFIKDGEECVLMKEDKYIEQIDEILNNYKKYEIIRENGRKVVLRYTWENWTRELYIEICRKFFDPDFYSSLYSLEKSNDLFEKWKNEGLNKNHICYKFETPKNFQSENYKKDNCLENHSDDLAYVHWFSKSKNKKYLIIYNKNKTNSIKTDLKNDCFITFVQYSELCLLFDKIKNDCDKNENLMKIGSIVKSNPGILINEIIQDYFNNNW